MRTPVLRKPPSPCVACGETDKIRVLEVIPTSDGLVEFALCLDFINCNRRWGFRGTRND